MEQNPYKTEAGPELDALIHAQVMKHTGASEPCPAYSTDDKQAKQVLSMLRLGRPSVIVGRTTLEGRSWFARYERNAMDGTEVLAGTFALAICRLALLRSLDAQAGR